MTTYDEDSANRLREAVHNAGTGPRLTYDQIWWRIGVLTDPDWQQFLMITADEARASVKVYRRMLIQDGR